MSFKTAVCVLVMLSCACSRERKASEITGDLLFKYGFVNDYTTNAVLDSILPALNTMARHAGPRYFVLEKDYSAGDTNQILLIPFRRRSDIGSVTAFSDIKGRYVMLCPLQIKSFVAAHSLSDSTDVSGYMGLVLMHELAHFICAVPGGFDSGTNAKDAAPELGERDMGTEPQLMTRYKKLELKVDSLAVEMVKAGAAQKDLNCFIFSNNIKLAVMASEFTVFGSRILDDFGSTSAGLLKDNSWTHPNLELRLAFMNYYFNPSPQKWEQIQDYLYEREVAPVHRQELDVRINQDERR